MEDAKRREIIMYSKKVMHMYMTTKYLPTVVLQVVMDKVSWRM